MIDTSPAYFRREAERCRRLADLILDENAAKSLRDMAEEYETKADEIAKEG